MRRINYLTGIEGVTAGGTATINVPVNKRYHAFKLFYSENGTAASVTAGIDRVRVFVNGVIQRDLTPAQALAIAKLNGITPATGELPLYLSEPWRASVVGEESTSWDLAGQVKCTIEVQINSGATSPGIQALASFDFTRNVSNNQPFLAIVRHIPITVNAPSGQYDITTLPIRYPIQRIHLFGPGAGINSIEVTADGEKIQEPTYTQNARFLADYGLDVAASGISFPICFDYDQQISDALVVNQTLDVRINTAGAGAVTALVEQRANGFL